MTKKTTYIQFLPIIGILTFVALYIVAVYQYPGGSDFNPDAIGFDWRYNYWCNLNYKIALNGEINPARPIGIIGMYILASSLLYFFYEFPLFFNLKATWRQTIRISGLLSMICAVFIYTDYHDALTSLSALFGMISLLGVVIGLKQKGMNGFMWTGIISILLILTNGLIYFTQHFVASLPILQKVTFGLILIWIVSVNSRFGIRKQHS
ncbi:MAG: hypothetical protein P8P74_08890 [Crocinitomicaceae bacterium]|nr:hypothetical protein [Crocinitomicaceae bacterium]